MSINFGIIKNYKRFNLDGKDTLQIDFENNSSLTIQMSKYHFSDKFNFKGMLSKGTILKDLSIMNYWMGDDYEETEDEKFTEITPFSFLKKNTIKNNICAHLFIRTINSVTHTSKSNVIIYLDDDFDCKYKGDYCLEISYSY